MSTVIPHDPISYATGNGSATTAGFAFPLLLATDLRVTVDGEMKTLNVDYTVSGVGSPYGGLVNFTAAPANGSAIVMYRETELRRDTDYQTSGDFQADVVDADFVRIWHVLIEGLNGTRASSSALRVPVGEVVDAFPEAAARANRQPVFDSEGRLTLAVATTGDSATALDVNLRRTDSAMNGVGQLGYSAQVAYADDGLNAGGVLRRMRWATDRTSSGAGIVTGVVSAGQRTANALAINQHLTDLGAYGVLHFPAERIEFDASIVMMLGQVIVANGAEVVYYGTDCALNLIGNALNRIIFSVRGGRWTASAATNNAVFARLAWNMRSTEALNDVEVYGFGGGGIRFEGSNWVIYSHGLNIHDCGSNNGGAAIQRIDDASELADIRFFHALIEANGKPGTSTYGGVNLPCSISRISGIWFIDSNIEGNYGSGAEAFVENSDVYFANFYEETSYSDSAPSSGLAKNGIRLKNCNTGIVNARMTSFSPNVAGVAIIVDGGRIEISGDTLFDIDYGAGDVQILNGAKITSGTTVMRIIRDSTSFRLGTYAHASGAFDGRTGAVATKLWGNNVSSITRNSVGTYTVVMSVNAPSVNFHAQVTCYDSGGGIRAVTGSIRKPVSAASFVIDTTNMADAAVDADYITFAVFVE